MSNKTETVREVCIDLSMTAVRIGYRRPSDMGEICLIANRILAANERELAAKDAEIARLKAALKPVMNLDMSRFGFTVDYGECFNAVRESQRIVGAWDDKNYFDKENNNAKL